MKSSWNDGIVAVLDLDTLVYLVAYQNKDVDDVDIVVNAVDNYMTLILTKTNCTYYLGFIGGSKCFRHELYSEYKANRPESPDWFIKWKGVIRHRLIDNWKILISDGREAEDDCIISIEYYKTAYNCILVHVDKDLKFWEGNHFDYQKHEFYYVDELGKLELTKSKLKGDGLKWQYAQVLIGDSGDNIKGLPKFGSVKAYALLHDCKNEYSLLRRTYCAYLKLYKGDVKEYFKLQWQLIVMLKEESHGFKVLELVEYKKDTSIDDILGI